MSTPEPNERFAAGFMDDYFAEAEEHIVAVRRGLLTLEVSLGSAPPAAVIEELFRSFHSLKGISAMVELREAELIAHQMESCLRAVRQGDLTLSSTTFETLVDGARVLENVILTHRSGDPLPSITSFLDRLAALIPAAAPASPRVPGGDPSDAPMTEPAARRWLVTFAPSPELLVRGIKVDFIRTRLLQIGQVLKVTPRVIAGGIAFEFEVATDHEDELAKWRDDGLTYEPLANLSAAAPSPDAEPSPALPGTTRDERLPEVATIGPTNFVRVDLSRLDDLMRLVGDMVVTRARLEDTLHRIERHVPFQEWRALQDHNAAIERQLRDLREGVMRVRLVPVGEIFRRMPFVVRDLARDSGKRVRLDLVGQATEIDKFLIERMMDPVLHLVRNAIGHAIETPDERTAAGKPPEGTIRLAASTAGESVILEIADDGAGIDEHAVAQRARAAGIPVPDAPMDARTILDIICSSGFSTRSEADRVSGRGVGMGVVRSTVEGLGGTIALSTQSGRGTAFTMTLPLTLAITDAIVVHVGDQRFAVPQSAVREVIEVNMQALQSIERHELLTYRGGTLPIVRLAHLFAIPVRSRPRCHALVVGSGLGAVGLLVDRIAGQQEIVVKAASDPLIRVDGVSGATELGDGRLVLILDAIALSRLVRERPRTVDGRSA